MRVWLVLFVWLLAGPALALSCVRPDVATTFLRATEAREVFIVAHGTLTFDQSLVPKTDLSDQNRPDTHISARLNGTLLSLAGFETSFKRDVSLVLQCFGPWCGGAVSGTDYLVFVQRTAAGYVVNMDPCGSFAFPEPTEEQLDQAASCMRGEACAPLQ